MLQLWGSLDFIDFMLNDIFMVWTIQDFLNIQAVIGNISLHG